MRSLAALTKTVKATTAALRDAMRPAFRKRPHDPWLSADVRRHQIDQARADANSWLRGLSRGWLRRRHTRLQDESVE